MATQAIRLKFDSQPNREPLQLFQARVRLCPHPFWGGLLVWLSSYVDNKSSDRSS